MNTTLRSILTGSAVATALLVPSTSALAASPSQFLVGPASSADVRADWYEEGYRHGFPQGWNDARRLCRKDNSRYRLAPHEQYERGYRDGYDRGFEKGWNRYCHRRDDDHRRGDHNDRHRDDDHGDRYRGDGLA